MKRFEVAPSFPMTTQVGWIPAKFDLGINSHGLHFLEPLNKAIIRTVPFVEAVAVAVHNTRVFGLETSSYGILLIETEGEVLVF